MSTVQRATATPHPYVRYFGDLVFAKPHRLNGRFKHQKLDGIVLVESDLSPKLAYPSELLLELEKLLYKLIRSQRGQRTPHGPWGTTLLKILIYPAPKPSWFGEFESLRSSWVRRASQACSCTEQLPALRGKELLSPRNRRQIPSSDGTACPCPI